MTIPPYFAQWETPRLVSAFLAGRPAATDPGWAGSGAESLEEYARWAEHLCGMACLRMVLAARGQAETIHALRRAVQAHGGYVETPDGDIKGLIYAGAVEWLATQSIPARVLVDVAVEGIPALLRGGGMFIVSVHPWLRWPEREPPRRGGHLVLVFGQDRQGRLRFHNPSGHTAATRRDARLSLADFNRFYAGRGIALP